MDDARLIALSRAGNPRAFATLVSRHEREVRAFVAGRVGLLGPVDDIATEAFTRAWLGLAGLEREASFGSWVKGIARLVIAERTRESARQDRAAERPADRAAPGPVESAGDERLLRAVDQLPEALREIVALRFFAGLSCAQAAERLGVPIGTVTKRLSRAYAELRRLLDTPDAPAHPDTPKHQEIMR